MDERRVLSYDPMSGMTVYYHFDEQTDAITLEYEQDVESVLEAAKTAQNTPEYSRQGIKNEMWHYGTIPNILITKWLVEEGINVYDDNDWKKVWQKLNDPDYKYLKMTTKHHE